MQKAWSIRQARRADYADLGRLVHTAIHSTPSPYTAAQRRAWSPRPRHGGAWNARLKAQYILLAKIGHRSVGFMSLAKGGYVDFAYILASARGTGLFRALHDGVEVKARAQGLTRLTTHASLRAQPAFTALGYRIIKPETVIVKRQRLRRFAMEKMRS